MIIPAIRTWKSADAQTAVNVTSLADAHGLADVLQNHQYGGIILFGSNVKDTAQVTRLVSELQVNNAAIEATTKIPYLMPVDGEGGVVTRLSSGTRMTGSMAIGATGDEAVNHAETTGDIIGEELAAVGFNADFAPSIDVNCNPANPAIGTRSFSDDPEVVTNLGTAFGKGLAKNDVIATYKHFPGHGDTATDSHSGLPVVDKTREQLDATELVPFKSIVGTADMIMSAHIVLPQIDDEVTFADSTKGHYPATMSKKIMNDILRDEMGYKGVVITDALEMDALYKSQFVEGDNGASESGSGEAGKASTEYKINLAEKIINAGVDILLVPTDLVDADASKFYDDYINGIAQKVTNGVIPQARIDESVKRILDLKKKHGILGSAVSPVSDEEVNDAIEIVGSDNHHAREMGIAQKAITLVKNERRALPASGSECNIVIVGRTKSDNTIISYAISDMQDLGYIDSDARVVNLAADSASGPENALTTITVGYYYDANDTVNPQYSDELKAAVAKADTVICLSTNWGLGTLQPTHAQYKGVTAVLGDAQKANAATVLLSCNLPYDAARYQDDADAIVLCYMSTDTDVDPTARNESLGRNAYNANVLAALEAMFVPDDLEDYATLGPQGHLPVNVPEGVVAESGEFSYSPTSILYKRGYGLTYADTPGVGDDVWGGDLPIVQEENVLQVVAVTDTIDAEYNKAKEIASADAFNVVENQSKGELTYTKVKGDAKIKVAENGDISIAEGLTAGKTYAVQVKVSSAETGEYKAATTSVSFNVKVAKRANTLKVKPAKAKLKASSNKKTKIAAKKAFKVVKNMSKAKLRYKKVKGNAKIKVSKAGKVTVAKGLVSGKTYRVKVKVSSAATSEYRAATTTVKLKVKVK